MITFFWAVGITFTVFIFAGKAGLVAALKPGEIMMKSLQPWIFPPRPPPAKPPKSSPSQ